MLQLRHASARPLRRDGFCAGHGDANQSWGGVVGRRSFRGATPTLLRQAAPRPSPFPPQRFRSRRRPETYPNVVTQQAIQDLPLNGRRFTDLALLSPGRDAGSTRAHLGFQWRSVRWRRSRLSEQLPGRRHGRQQLVLRPGTRPLSRPLPVQQRSHQGISRLEELLQRGAGSLGRRGVQRRHQVRHERVAWQRLLLPARSRLRCGAAVRPRPAQRPPAAVRRHDRRTHSQRPRLLLCRIRSGPADRSFDRAVCQWRQHASFRSRTTTTTWTSKLVNCRRPAAERHGRRRIPPPCKAMPASPKSTSTCRPSSWRSCASAPRS